MSSNKKIIVFSHLQPMWLLETNEKGLLACTHRNGTTSILHDHPIAEFDADIDKNDNLHAIALSSLGLLIHYVITTEGKSVYTLSRVHIESQRLANLHIFSNECVDIFYTISNLPFVNTTLVHYSNAGTWSGKRILELAPNTKSVTLCAEKNDDSYNFYIAYSVQSAWTVKKAVYNPAKTTVSEFILAGSDTPIASLDACDGHYAFSKDGSAYFDGMRVSAGEKPVIMLKNGISCIVTRQNKQILLQNIKNAWRMVAEFPELEICRVRGEAPVKCSQAPFSGFPNFAFPPDEYNIPFGFNTASAHADHSDLRLRRLEEQLQNSSKIILNLQAQVHRIVTELEKLRNSIKN
ncbi:MAG TPA: hypothetical protein PLZ84_03780 [Clostridia bacterium]|nr:hypothetical protein [Clostridia bacterium]